MVVMTDEQLSKKSVKESMITLVEKQEGCDIINGLTEIPDVLSPTEVQQLVDQTKLDIMQKPETKHIVESPSTLFDHIAAYQSDKEDPSDSTVALLDNQHVKTTGAIIMCSSIVTTH